MLKTDFKHHDLTGNVDLQVLANKANSAPMECHGQSGFQRIENGSDVEYWHPTNRR